MTDESKLFFEEGFADIDLSKTSDESAVLRLGRQEFEFGSGRFVDVREGPNVRQAFDGVSAKWRTSAWTVDGLAAKPVLNGNGVLDAPPNHGSTFWGVYAVHPLPEIKGGNIDLYYLGLARKNTPYNFSGMIFMLVNWIELIQKSYSTFKFGSISGLILKNVEPFVSQFRALLCVRRIAKAN